MRIGIVALLFAFWGGIHGDKVNSKTKEGSKHLPKPKPTHPPHHGKHEATTKICPPHFWLEKGWCIKKEEVPFTKVCRPDTLDKGEEGCLEFTAATFKCNGPNERLVGEQCLKKEEKPHEFFCPAVAPLSEEHKCTTKFQEPAACRKGETQISLNGVDYCIKTELVDRKCPPGFQLRGLLCVKVELTKPRLECPLVPHFFLTETKCFFKTEVEKICPKFFADVGGDECVKFEAKEKTCLPGYKLEGDECVKREEKPKELYCANGANPENNCRKAIIVPTTPTCEHGSKLVHGVCEKVVRRPASYTCPKDYKPKEGKCETEIEYDCSTTTHELECKRPHPGHKEPHGHKERPQKEDKQHAEVAKYIREKEHVLPVCHKVPIVHPKKCKRYVYAEGIPYCKKGVYKGNKICEFVEKSIPKSKCEARKSKDGKCFVEETSVPIRKCPPGFSIGHGGSQICTRTDVKGVILKCPADTTEPLCAKKAKKECPGGNCDRFLTTRATISCPLGYEELKKEHETICRQTLAAEFINFCRTPGATMEGLYCLLSKRRLTPEFGKASFPAEAFCPKYFADLGPVCAKNTFFPAIPECKKPYYFKHGRCVRKSHKLIRCPKGSVNEKGKCWAFEKAEPIVVKTVVRNDWHSQH